MVITVVPEVKAVMSSSVKRCIMLLPISQKFSRINLHTVNIVLEFPQAVLRNNEVGGYIM